MPSKPAALSDVLNVAALLGHPPTQREYDLNGQFATRSVMRVVTGLKRGERWHNVLEIAGYKVQHGGGQRTSRRFTDEEIYSDLRRIAVILGHPPTSTEYKLAGGITSRITVMARNGNSWRKAIKNAGLQYEYRHAGYMTLQEFREDIEAVAKKVGAPPSMKDYRKYGKASPQRLIARTQKTAGRKTWADVLEQFLGLPADVAKMTATKLGRPNSKTIEEQLQEVRDFAAQLGRAPLSNEAWRGGLTPPLLQRKLRTNWEGVIRAAGLTPHRTAWHEKRDMSKQETWEEVERVVEHYDGLWPSLRLFSETAILAPYTVVRRLGFSRWSQVRVAYIARRKKRS